MKRVGFIGLGKLGLPCAAALSARTGLEVHGYDSNPRVADYIADCRVPYQEKNIEEYLEEARLKFHVNAPELLAEADIVFVAVQTPHDPRYEGNSPVPDETQDFDYSFLVAAVGEIRDFMISNPNKHLTLVVISTVLPGTMRRYILPMLSQFESRLKFCYNPFFIAMGTTIDDYLHPEFVLIGENRVGDATELIEIYKALHDAEIIKMKIESAELTKVAYNTFIGFKIVFANTIAEIVDGRGGDADEVTQALAKANQRLLSGKYLSAGMADGGGCHPRDQIAMSWLAAELGLSTNIFDFLARSRDAQTLRQAEFIAKLADELSLPVCLMGYAYKADVNLTVGSPAVLLSHFLRNLRVDHTIFDPFCFPTNSLPSSPGIFFVSTNHSMFQQIRLPKGSHVVDPWGNSVAAQDGVVTHRPGRDTLG